MKPKSNEKNIPERDRCQTPPYAVEPLLQYLESTWTIWECAAGEGYLADAIEEKGFSVVKSDILTGQNFFKYTPGFSAIVTNPPFSIKYKWLRHCYHLDKPFALLLPLETLGAKSAQKLFKKHGMQLLVLNKRVNFKMPNTGWNGTAQFPVAWFTWKMNLESEIVYGQISPRPVNQMVLLRAPNNGRTLTGATAPEIQQSFAGECFE